MHQLLILSDSHGLTNEIMEIRDRHREIEHIIHCGDSELPIDAPELQGMLHVAGNCDYGEPYPEEKEVIIGGLTIFVTHGHFHQVKQSLMSLSYYVENKNVDVILYGHNHIANAQNIGEQLFINPGSIRFPRNRVERTYAIMKWESLDQIEVHFYTVSGEPVPQLYLETSIRDHL